MSTRERWIVYPLIFLTLGIALRDKLLYRVKTNDILAQRVACTELVADNVLIRKGTRMNVAECRTMIVHGPNGNPVVALGVDATTDGGGAVTTFSPTGKAARLGSVGANLGVFVRLPGLEQWVLLTPQFEFKPNEAAPSPKGPNKPAAPPAQPPKDVQPKKTGGGK